MSELIPVGGLQLFGFKLEGEALVPVGEPTFENYVAMAAYLGHCERVTRWAIGDLLNEAEKQYGETYAQIEGATGMSVPDLMNCKSISSKFEISRRREISWSHHQAVSGLAPEKQDEILELAVSDGLTREQVRDIVREEKGLPPRGAAIIRDPVPSSSEPIDVTPPPIPDDHIACAACDGKGHVPEPQKPRKAGDTVGATFDIFYATYPRHVGRADAEKAWRKLKPDQNLVQVILAALEQQKQQPRWREDPQFIPHPSRWLNAKRWEDEIDAPSGNNGRQEILDWINEDEGA